MDNSEFTQSEFDKRANSAREWLFVADDLLTSSRFLCLHSYHLHPEWGNIDQHFPTFDELRITPVILMLRAMALECLLKALYVKHCDPLGSSGRYQKITKKNEHNLAEIARIISAVKPLGLSQQQINFLDRASLNIVKGRYPVHIDWLKHNMPHASGDRRRNAFMVPDFDDDFFTSTSELFRSHLSEEANAMYADLDR